jgi:hypothetical protein
MLTDASEKQMNESCFELRRFERILNGSGYQPVEPTFGRGKKLEFHVMLLTCTQLWYPVIFIFFLSSSSQIPGL